MAMTAKDLNFIELQELKQTYLVEKLRAEGRTPTYGEIRDAGSIPDNEIIDYYENTVFTTSDFHVSRVMDEMDFIYTVDSMEEDNTMAEKTLVDRIRQINPSIIDEDGNIQSFKEQLLDYMTGDFDVTKPMVVSCSSQILGYINKIKQEEPILINISILVKSRDDHGLSYKFLKELENNIEESVLAFESPSNNNNVVVVLDKEDGLNDKPIIVAITLDKRSRGNILVNDIRSIYNRENFENYITKAYRENKIFYKNEKTKQFFSAYVGSRCPEGLITALQDDNIKLFNLSQVEQLENEKTEAFTKSAGVRFPMEMINLLRDDSINSFEESQEKSDRLYTLDEILDRAEGAAHLSPELKAKDEAFSQLASRIGEEEGINLYEEAAKGNIDSVEEYILDYVEENNWGVMFSVTGNIEYLASLPHREFFVEDQIAERESIERMYSEEEPTIDFVSENELANIIETREPRGLFYTESRNQNGVLWTGVDNTDGEAWTEDFTSYEVMEEWLRGTAEMDNKEYQDQKKIHISLHENYCFRRESEVTGRVYNQMTMPKGTMLDGRDIGGYKITPAFMGKSRYVPNEMVATYYVPEDRPLEVKLIKGAETEKVDIEKIKEAVDNQKAAYREAMKEQSRSIEKAQNHVLKKEKDQGEEL